MICGCWDGKLQSKIPTQNMVLVDVIVSYLRRWEAWGKRAKAMALLPSFPCPFKPRPFFQVLAATVLMLMSWQESTPVQTPYANPVPKMLYDPFNGPGTGFSTMACVIAPSGRFSRVLETMELTSHGSACLREISICFRVYQP